MEESRISLYSQQESKNLIILCSNNLFKINLGTNLEVLWFPTLLDWLSQFVKGLGVFAKPLKKIQKQLQKALLLVGAHYKQPQG